MPLLHAIVIYMLYLCTVRKGELFGFYDLVRLFAGKSLTLQR